MGSAALIALLAAPGAFNASWFAAVSSDATGGLISVTPGAAARATVTAALGPGAGLRMRAGTWEATADYNIRFARRFELSDPLTSGVAVPTVERFLVMHNFSATTQLRLARGWSLGAYLRGSRGEVDVPSAPLVLENGEPSGVTPGGTTGGTTGTGDPSTTTFGSATGILNLFTISGGVNLSGMLTKQVSFSIEGSAGTTQPVGEVDPETAAFQPDQSNFGAVANTTWQITPRDGLTTSLTVEYSLSTQGGDYRNLMAMAGYTHRFGRQTDFGVSVGLLWLRLVGEPPDMAFFLVEPPESVVLPVFSASLGTQLFTLSFMSASFSWTAGISSQQNFITGAFEPRLASNASLSLVLGRSWSLGVNVDLNTLATLSPNEQGETVDTDMLTATSQQLLSETTFGVTVPVTYQVTRDFRLGAQYAYTAFGERFASPNFAFVSPSHTVMVTASVRIDDRF